jgi:hypothetical protein
MTRRVLLLLRRGGHRTESALFLDPESLIRRVGVFREKTGVIRITTRLSELQSNVIQSWSFAHSPKMVENSLALSV